MKEIKEKQESSAQVSTVAKKFVVKCPKCGSILDLDKEVGKT